MLSSALGSDTAIRINIHIVRAFIFLKQYNSDFKLLQKRIIELESKFNRKVENINELIEFLLSKPEPKAQKPKPRKLIGFKTHR